MCAQRLKNLTSQHMLHVPHELAVARQPVRVVGSALANGPDDLSRILIQLTRN